MSAKIAVNFVGDLRDRVNAAGFGRRRAHGQADINRLADKPGFDGRIFQFALARNDRLRDAIAQAVDRRPHDLALVRRHLAKRLQALGNRALLADGAHAHRFDARLVFGGSDIGHQFLFEFGQFFHSSKTFPRIHARPQGGPRRSPLSYQESAAGPHLPLTAAIIA